MRRTGRLPDGTPVEANYLMGGRASVSGGPDAFLVQQPRGSRLPAHFHFNRQFQIFVEGSGILGRHRVGPVTIHYAAGQTGYGPIIAGEHGLSYLTLRQTSERGAHYLPASAGSMEPGTPRRQKTVRTALVHERPLAGYCTPQIRELIAPDQSGLACWSITLPPMGAAREPGEAGYDRFAVVLQGELVVPLAATNWSVVWFSAEEPLQYLAAGSPGARLLLMRFPLSA